MTIAREILSFVKIDEPIEVLSLEALSKLHYKIRPESGNAAVFVTSELVLAHLKNDSEIPIVAIRLESDKTFLFDRIVVTFKDWPHNLLVLVELDEHTVKKVVYTYLEV